MGEIILEAFQGGKGRKRSTVIMWRLLCAMLMCTVLEKSEVAEHALYNADYQVLFEETKGSCLPSTATILTCTESRLRYIGMQVDQ